MTFTRKRAFSLVEMLLIVFLLAVGMTALIVTINFGTGFVQKTRQKIIAVNLAREGMEEVMNIRDSNRNIWAGRKEECRLKMDPFDMSSCDDWFASGQYIITEQLHAGQRYFVLSGGDLGPIDVSDGLNTGELVYSLCQSGQTRQACPGSQPMSVEGHYLRQIVGLGLYQKNTSTSGGIFLDCHGPDDLSSTCSDGNAKEFRFCSRVYYIGDGYGMIELCGLITNFAQ